MQCAARLVDIDAINGGLADGGDIERDYAQTDQKLAAKLMQDLEPKWAVALNKDEGDGIWEEEEE